MSVQNRLRERAHGAGPELQSLLHEAADMIDVLIELARVEPAQWSAFDTMLAQIKAKGRALDAQIAALQEELR